MALTGLVCHLLDVTSSADVRREMQEFPRSQQGYQLVRMENLWLFGGR